MEGKPGDAAAPKGPAEPLGAARLGQGGDLKLPVKGAYPLMEALPSGCKVCVRSPATAGGLLLLVGMCLMADSTYSSREGAGQLQRAVGARDDTRAAQNSEHVSCAHHFCCR